MTTKVTEAEYRRLEEQAELASVNMSEWVRRSLLAADRPSRDTEVLLGEVLALRTILINILFSLSHGNPITPETMKELIARADRKKAEQVMERLTAVPREPRTEAEMEGG